MCGPQTTSARMTGGGPCARRVRHGEPLQVTGRTTSVEVTAYGPSITSCPNDYHQFECGEAEAEFNENLTRIRHS